MQIYKLRIKNKGQAALIAVVFMLAITLSAVFGIIALAFKEIRVAGENNKAKNSYFTAEAGIEDAIYRFKSGMAVGGSYTLTLNNSSADITVNAISGSERNIISVGDSSGSNRSVSVDLVTSTTGANFYYGVQVGDGGLEMGNNAVVTGNVYSNGNITGENGATITGSATVAGGINVAPSIEALTTDSNYAFATASSNRDIAQSFTANVSDRINKVSVYLAKVGNPSGSITLKIATDNAGSPSTGNLASTAIPSSSIGVTPAWVDVAFSSPPNLTSGTKYWIVLDYGSNSATNYWTWGRDSTDSYTGNTGKYTSNCCSGSPSWTNVGGDLAFQVWIGGVNTKIEGMVIGNASSGEGRANLFVNSTIHGSVCPNSYCFMENPPREELPLPDGVIEDWRDDAASGGTCVPPTCDASGNFTLSNGSSISLGPIKITGNLTLSNNSTLTVNGTIYVMGTISFSNGCIIRLSSAYGPLSGIIIGDDSVSVSNNCSFLGSGSPESYIMLLTDKNDPPNTVMSVSNNSDGVIYYASKGFIDFSNNATAKEATAYGIDLANNASITYESGLANVNFAAGPSGGWDIKSWQEIIP